MNCKVLKAQKAALIAQVSEALKRAPEEMPEETEEQKRLTKRLWRVRNAYAKCDKRFPTARAARKRRLYEWIQLVLDAHFDLWPLVVFAVPDGGPVYRIINSRAPLAAFLKALKAYPVSTPEDNDRVSIPDPTRVPKAPAKRPTGDALVKLLAHAFSKDPAREELHSCLRREPGELAACDGHRLAVLLDVENDRTDSATDYRLVVPGYKANALPSTYPGDPCKDYGPLDATDLYEKCVLVEKAIVTTYDEPLYAHLYAMPDRTVEIGGEGYESGYTGDGADIAAVRVEYLREALGFLLRAGNPRVTLRAAPSDAWAPVLLLGEKEYCLIMPARPGTVPQAPLRKKPVDTGATLW
jgi:hypothetical protein